MGEIVDINTQKEGDLSFVLCDCNPEEPEAPLVQCLMTSKKVMVTGLVCPGCERFTPVLDGELRQDLTVYKD